MIKFFKIFVFESLAKVFISIKKNKNINVFNNNLKKLKSF